MTNNKQQTAVEWLLNEIETKNGEEFSSYYLEFIEQAKEIEKEQIEDAYKRGWDSGDFGSDCWEEIYYNETYGGNK
jgi:hypothetical protein